MVTDTFVPSESFEGIALAFVNELGIESVRLENLGQRLGVSRASMYRAYRSVGGIFKQLHEVILERLDAELDAALAVTARRSAFEAAWSRTTTALSSSAGRAFRAIRPVVATGEGIEALVRAEVRQLKALTRWLSTGTPPPTSCAPVSAVVWMLLLNAVDADKDEAAVLRELAWSTIAGQQVAERHAA